MRAVDTMDSESAATAILWLEVTATPNSTSTSLTASWQTFVDQRIESWRTRPSPIHASHVLRLSPYQYLGLPQTFRDCHNVRTQYVLSTKSDPETVSELDVPHIHGLIHDRAWLCFWKHPILRRYIQNADWHLFCFAVVMWMAHLASVEYAAEAMKVIRRDQLPYSASNLLTFFGGVSLPILHASQC